MRLNEDFQLDMYGRFKPNHYYLALFRQIPSIKSLYVEKNVHINDVKEALSGFDVLFSEKTYAQGQEFDYDFLVSKDRRVLIDTDLGTSRFPPSYPTITIYYLNGDDESAREILERLMKFRISEDRSSKINFLIATQSGYELMEESVPKVDFDYNINYNTGQDYETIVESVGNDGSGFLLFSGEPGTGKTTLIKKLISEIDKKFVFVPAASASGLDGPSFVSFCFSDLKDSILVVEDCEEAVVSRKSVLHSPVSSILNITDGIYGDVLNLKVLSTQNVVENIDEALLRQGRLINRVEFARIDQARATELSKSLGYNNVYDSPQLLCDVYNPVSNNSEKPQIGFKK